MESRTHLEVGSSQSRSLTSTSTRFAVSAEVPTSTMRETGTPPASPMARRITAHNVDLYPAPPFCGWHSTCGKKKAGGVPTAKGNPPYITHIVRSNRSDAQCHRARCRWCASFAHRRGRHFGSAVAGHMISSQSSRRPRRDRRDRGLPHDQLAELAGAGGAASRRRGRACTQEVGIHSRSAVLPPLVPASRSFIAYRSAPEHSPRPAGSATLPNPEAWLSSPGAPRPRPGATAAPGRWPVPPALAGEQNRKFDFDLFN